MKKGIITAAVLLLTGVAALQTQAQTTSSENNASKTAQSKSGNGKDDTTDPSKSRTTVSRTVTGSRPENNSTTDRFGRNRQTSREKRDAVPSDADGKTNVSKGRPKADAKTREKRGKGRSFGNTGNN